MKKTVQSRLGNIKRRCTNPKCKVYNHYGARGINVGYEFSVDLYHDFADKIVEYASTHGIRNATFDRINVNQGYTKENIRIADQKIQSTNTTRKKLFILEQKESRVICDSAMEFGRRYGVNGRSVGNLVRGKTKSAGGWTLYKLIPLPLSEPIETIIEKESVTTNLLTTM